MLRPKSFALVVCSLAAPLGCGKKVPECNALVKQLNDSSAAMQSATTGVMTNPKQAKEAIEKLAATTKAETEKLAKVELTVPELQGFSKSYQVLLGEMVSSAQAIAKANGDADGIQDTVTKAQSGWMTASSKLAVACARARKECVPLDELLTKPPSISGIEPARDAGKLDEYVKKIADVDVKNADVKAAVEDIKKYVGEFSTALRKSGEAQDAVENATKSLTEAGNKEPALVKSINDFCQAG